MATISTYQSVAYQPVGINTGAPGQANCRDIGAQGGAKAVCSDERQLKPIGRGRGRRLYVDRRWHGGGTAHALLDRAIAIAMQRGAQTLYLSVWQHNHRAIAFYVKHGFVRVGAAEFQLGADVQLDPVMQRPLPAVPVQDAPAAATSRG